MTFPIPEPPDNAAPYTYTGPIRRAIAAVNDHEPRIDALEAALAALQGSTAPTPSPSIFVYGSGYQMDGLGNMQVGGSASGSDNTYVSYYFVAATSSALNSVMVYVKTSPGYGGGNFGTIRISIQADVNGFPSGTNLAFVDVVAPIEDASNLYTFGSPASLTAGTKYHVVFTNINASPTVNFVSINCTYNDFVKTPRQLRFADSAFGATRKFGTGGSWAQTSEEKHYTPILQLTYANGVKQGQGYLELSYSGSGGVGIISGTSSMIRERFTVSGGNRTVTGAGVRVQRLTGSGTADLLVRLENSVGTLIDSFTVPAASIPTGVEAGTGENALYVVGSFAQTRTLTNGSVYNLRLSCAAGTTYHTWAIRKGSTYDYVAPTFFDDGISEKTTDGSTWSSFGRVSNENDLQFYFW